MSIRMERRRPPKKSPPMVVQKRKISKNELLIRMYRLLNLPILWYTVPIILRIYLRQNRNT